ncbi:MAG: chorismate synthase [Bacteroidales bacterium]|nr:chorismate synthase [Candidatus Colicola coprequi]
MANTFGDKWTFTSFGESHGRAIGGVIDGVPAGLQIDFDLIRRELLRRSGKEQIGVSPRPAAENDEVEWLSGVMDGVALGTPIAFLIRNTDARPDDYEILRHTYRPGHADWVYQRKYGIRDHRGGGRSSARETAARVVAGTIARQQLNNHGISIHAQLVQVGEETHPEAFDNVIRQVREAGDTIGGIVECAVNGMPVGVGDPIADKLQAHLAAAMLSINGCKGFDYGTGFRGVALRGSQIYHPNEVPCPQSGGIEGGISNGLPITFRCVFKPAATLTRLYGGRHDACIAVRAVPVVEAMTALVLADLTSNILLP